MTKCFSLTLVLFFIGITLVAQQRSVSVQGAVLDQENGEPLEYATLILQSVENPDELTGGITNINGKFNVETEPGAYNISVEYLSYKTYSINKREINSDIDLGTIRLQVDATQPEAVEVIGEKTTVEVRLDKKSIILGRVSPLEVVA